MERAVSLVIPAYNEEDRIGRTLQDLSGYLSKNYPEFEIIVIDDGRADGTSRVSAPFTIDPRIKILRNDKNMGKGFSVRRGVLASSGDVVLFSDADQSVPISELPRFLDMVDMGADVVVASRAMKESKILKRQALWRQTMGKIFNMFVRILAFGGIADTQCGFKCFKRKAAMQIFSQQKIDGFAFDVEILYLAKQKGYTIREAAVKWINSPKSKVRPFGDSLSMLKDLLLIRSLHGRI